MIPFSMVVLNIFAQRPPQGGLAKKDHLEQALLLHRPDPTLRIGCAASLRDFLSGAYSFEHKESWQNCGVDNRRQTGEILVLQCELRADGHDALVNN